MIERPFAVCIPARDEQELLPRLLGSLETQSIGWDRGVVVVVANNCTDGTVNVARAWSDRLPLIVADIAFSTADAHVGTARKLALDEGCAMLEAKGDAGLLLTTDADAVLPSDWIAGNLRAAERSDIVGGRLIPDFGGHDRRTALLQETIERYWEAVRAIEDVLDPSDYDPAPRHGDHTGASLCFSSALYRQVGGMPPLATREDAAFVERTLHAGARLRHCPDVSVHVSARLVGRASQGMAADMTRRLAVVTDGGTYALPHPDFWIERIVARRRLRMAWRDAQDCAAALLHEGVAVEDVSDILDACPNDIAFVERSSAVLPTSEPPLIAVQDALRIFEERKTRSSGHAWAQ